MSKPSAYQRLILNHLAMGGKVFWSSEKSSYLVWDKGGLTSVNWQSVRVLLAANLVVQSHITTDLLLTDAGKEALR